MCFKLAALHLMMAAHASIPKKTIKKILAIMGPAVGSHSISAIITNMAIAKKPPSPPPPLKPPPPPIPPAL
jgi:hypothetical protein